MIVQSLYLNILLPISGMHNKGEITRTNAQNSW